LRPMRPFPPEHLVLLTTEYWGAAGVRLTVGFLDNPPADLKSRILAHMNAWGSWSNVQFSDSSADPKVRIARTAGDGYWSYLGTDILHIAAGQPTMNLDSFTMNTPDSEFHRVIRHETGHTRLDFLTSTCGNKLWTGSIRIRPFRTSASRRVGPDRRSLPRCSRH
jgi:hypothetical protein